MINLSLSTVIMSDCLKTAVITPKLKKSTLDFEEFKNFRLVSNLMFILKIIERPVAFQLNNHLDANGLNEVFQSDYKKQHSTETALLRVNNDILRAIDDHSTIILVLLDLPAAFDTVDHSILLNRLNCCFGIKNTALHWFKSYLTNRKQLVNERECLLIPKPRVWSASGICARSYTVCSVHRTAW